MPDRKFSAGTGYRYGFNGQEKSRELIDGLTTALYWEYDSRIARRWNLDPKPNTFVSDYSCLNNNPNLNIDPLGDIFRGLNTRSAGRAKENITETLSAISNNTCEKLSQYFKIGDDKVTFDKIDVNKLKGDLSELKLNAKQEALILGMVQVINDGKLHFIGIVDPNENQQNLINNAKGINKKFFGDWNGGPTKCSPSQSVSMIFYNQDPNSRQFTPHTPFRRCGCSLTLECPRLVSDKRAAKDHC